MVKVVQALVVVVAGYMSLMGGGRLTMVESLGMCQTQQLMVSQAPVILMTYRPEDMFGSLEVDANGQFVGSNGNYQPSGMFVFRIGFA